MLRQGGPQAAQAGRCPREGGEKFEPERWNTSKTPLQVNGLGARLSSDGRRVGRADLSAASSGAPRAETEIDPGFK
jgi:hypothetical protein